jgi:CRP/FNR family transcriptional regulator, cyclic AMP receptor protein
MISDPIAPLASTIWMATAMLWRPTTRRRYALDTDGQPPAKAEPDRMNDDTHGAGPRRGPENRDVYQALIASGIFGKIDPDRVSAVSEQLEPLRFSPGEVMDAQNDCGGCVYVIVSGKVKVAHRRPEGNEMVLTILGPREIFGAIGVFDPESREIEAIALTEVVAVPIGRDQFLDWISECPEFSHQVLRLFARWVKASTNSLVDFAFADVDSRVANQLLCLRKRFGRQEGEVVRVVHELTMEDFSLLVGVAPETVSETLRKFEIRGWIRLEDKSVMVVDAHALASVPHMSAPEVHCA